MNRADAASTWSIAFSAMALRGLADELPQLGRRPQLPRHQ